jgi:excisionase family DNA binding protein
MLPTSEDDPLLAEELASQLMGVSLERLRELVDRGDVSSVAVGRRRLAVRLSEVRRFAEANRNEP